LICSLLAHKYPLPIKHDNWDKLHSPTQNFTFHSPSFHYLHTYLLFTIYTLIIHPWPKMKAPNIMQFSVSQNKYKLMALCGDFIFQTSLVYKKNIIKNHSIGNHNDKLLQLFELKSSHPKVLEAFVLTDQIHGRPSQDKCT